MNGWQPIATAPHDGTCVLVRGIWAGGINGPDRDDDPHTYIAFNTGVTRTDYPGFNWEVIGTDASAAWVRPTHWQPLPGEPA